jgi:hypothetical protein
VYSLLLVCVLPIQCAHETAGAAGTRHSPRPHRGARFINGSGAARGEIVKSCLENACLELERRHCERSDPDAVIPGWSAGPDPESRDSGFDVPHRPGMTESGFASRSFFAQTRWLAMTDARREHPTCSPHNSLALLNANDDTRLVFSSRISVRVIGGSARWLQFSRSQSRQLTPIGVPSVFSRSIPVA